MDTVQFVDSISASPTVRLNLNDGITWGLNYQGTDISPPALKTAWASSLLVDGERLTAAAYSNRRLRLALDLMAANPDAAAAQEQALWRELDRPSNLLMWKPEGATNPVFFQTIRSSNNRVTELPGGGGLRLLDVEIEAKPFGIGLRETQPTATVYNDPAEGTTLNANPFFETDASNWSAVAGGTVARSTAQAHEGVASLLFTPDGVTATVEARSESAPGVVAGQTYRVSAWVRCAVARNVNANIVWRDAAGVFLSSAGAVSISVAATTWALIEVSGVAPALAAQGQISVSMGGTPPASNTLRIDEARLRQVGGVGGMCLDLGTIKGDVPAPLYLQVRAADVTATPAGFTTGDGHRTTAIAMRRGGTPSAMPAVLQAEAMTMSTDTTLQAAVASSSGQFARTTFVGNPNLTSRMSIAAFPVTPSVDARGTYRVFVRCRKSVDTDVVQVQLNYVSDDAGVFTDVGTVPSTVWRWVDLGLISMPLGYDPVTDALSGVPVSVQGLSAFLYAARVSGTGTLDVDVVMHLPADDRLCYVKWPQFGSQTNYVVDAVANMVYATSSSGEIRGTLPEMNSLPPMASPGVANRVWLMRDVGAEYVSGDDIAASVRVTPYYYPQYLRVRGATS